jgi:hypothetical protein
MERAVRGIASSIGGKAVNAKVTSYGALEMDVFLGSRADFDFFLAAIEPLAKLEFYKDLQEPPVFLPTTQAVTEAVSLFNGERFWEAHEVLESLWRVAEGEEKRVLQGLILVCAAFVHLQKGEMRVALGVAKRSLPLLVWESGAYHGISIGPLRGSIEEMVGDGNLSLLRL